MDRSHPLIPMLVLETAMKQSYGEVGLLSTARSSKLTASQKDSTRIFGSYWLTPQPHLSESRVHDSSDSDTSLTGITEGLPKCPYRRN
jgi:hypothetical protein